MLGKIGTVKDFAKLHKRIAILITVGVVAAIGIIIAIFTIWKAKSSQSTTSYREYTVSKGSVTVGTTESGTVALDDETVSLPIDCEIGSVLVKSGTSIKKGDPILQLNLNSVADGSADTVQKLEAAKVSLQSAINDQAEKLQAAKITYEANKYLAISAPITKELTQAQIAHDISSAQSTLKSDQKSLANYETLQKSWAADYGKLQNLENWMNDAKSSKTSYETQLSDFEDDNSGVISTYKSLKSAVDTDEQYYLAAKRGDTTVNGNDADGWEDQLEGDRDAYDAYNESIAASIISQDNALKDKVAQYTAEYNNYSSAYSDYKETFQDKYKSNDTEMSKTEIDDKVASLKASVETDQYNLEKAQKSAEISSMSAQQTEQTDLNSAKYAQSTYQLTVAQLNEAVTTAQSSYDKLQRQMDEINSALNNNGIVSSPCDGIVASISYKAGESITANDTIMTISGNDSISVSVSVSEDDITNISVGQEASISLSAYDDKTLDAAVDSITAEPARSGSSSVTYTVVVKSTEKVSNVGTVYDGMSADATILQHQVKSVLYVSNRAITFKDGISSVLVKDSSGNNVQKTVKTGFSDGTNVEIASGLEEGDTVLAESTVSGK